jgi:hypothetical protein
LLIWSAWCAQTADVLENLHAGRQKNERSHPRFVMLRLPE